MTLHRRNGTPTNPVGSLPDHIERAFSAAERGLRVSRFSTGVLNPDHCYVRLVNYVLID